MRKTRKRISKKRTRKQKGSLLRGGSCPPGVPPRICAKQEERAKRNIYSVTGNFKSNLNQALRNRKRRLMSEEERVAEARSKFNWKRNSKFNAIRKGEGINNNLSNEELQNIHEATNLDFPEPTGRPHAFNSFTGPPEYGPMRKKIYRNNM